MKKTLMILAMILVTCVAVEGVAQAAFVRINKQMREERRKAEIENISKQFDWWPTDAQPGAVKDDKKSGYWWWPTKPGTTEIWGNRGYVYLYKIIFDYKAEVLPPPKQGELRPSLLIRKVIKDVRIYFDYNKSHLRQDAIEILTKAVRTLEKNPESSILITGNTDVRGSADYNDKLGTDRAESVRSYIAQSGMSEDRIRIVSHGKLDALARTSDLVGMQKDRNAHFVIAEVEEVMLPYQGPPTDPNARQIGENKYLVESEETLESGIQVSTFEYVVRKGDTFSKIAKEQLGSAHRWVYLFELNKDRVDEPKKLKVGQTIIIPVE